MPFPLTMVELLTGVLAFIRIGGILFALPIFGDQPTPVQVRVLMSAVLAVCLTPLAHPVAGLGESTDAIAFMLYVVKELFIGLFIGYIAKLTFDGILMAASLVGFQMGFSTATLFVQDAGIQMDGFSAFHRVVAMLIFLSLNLHHIFLQALVETFAVIPIGGAIPHAPLGELVIHVSSGLLNIAIQLAAPVLVALMFAMAALGLVARTVPQVNVFVLSFPTSFFLGLVIYASTFPFFPEWMQTQFFATQANITTAIGQLSPHR